MAITYAKLWKGQPLVVDYTPGSAVTAGDVVIISNNIYFAVHDIAASVLGSLNIGGIWDLPKEASVAHAAGVLVYWDGTNHVVTTTAGSLKKLGIVAAAAADTDTRGKYLSIPQAV